MNYIDIRVYFDADPAGTCMLSDKRRTFVYPVEMPIGARKLTVCDAAFIQEIRKAILLGSEDFENNGQRSDTNGTTSNVSEDLTGSTHPPNNGNSRSNRGKSAIEGRSRSISKSGAS